MKFRWSIAPAQPLLAAQIARELGLSPLLAQCLLNRNLKDAASALCFLKPRLKQLQDPFLLPDMELAVDRLLAARERKERVAIFGDYDVDGVTSTALLVEALGALGLSVGSYLPNRMDEGYGLSQIAVDACLAKCPASVLLAVDCGSTSVECIAGLKTRGIDVIVLDHHVLGSVLPPAVALVNPQRNRSAAQGLGSFTELCSVGLAFKLAHALVKRGRILGLAEALSYDLRPLLDFVALGTIADLVPLTGENRILVSAGLERLNSTQRPGLVALKQVARTVEAIGVQEVGFQLAPRLNAAGRLETAEEALQLLLCSDIQTATALAAELNGRNRERQQIERRISEEAISVVRSRFNPIEDYVIVEGQPPWHIGVVGIVASRVLRQFYRPTIIIGENGGEWRGSGRSIAGFDLAAALRECGDLLIRHGGHSMAAGLTIEPSKLDLFRSRLNEIAQRELRPESLQPELRLDAEVGLDELTLGSIAELEQLRPEGQGNPRLQFVARNLVHQRPLQRMGAEKQHVKMWLSDGNVSREAVWWGAGNESLPVGHFDAAFTPATNEFNGRKAVQLQLRDWRSAETSPLML